MEQLFQLLDLTFSKILKILNIYIACTLSTIFLKYQFSSDYFFSSNNLQLILVAAIIWVFFNEVIEMAIFIICFKLSKYFRKKKEFVIDIFTFAYKRNKLATSPNVALRTSKKGIIELNKHLLKLSTLLLQIYFIFDNSIYLIIGLIFIIISFATFLFEDFLSNDVTREIRIRNRQNPINRS